MILSDLLAIPNLFGIPKSRGNGFWTSKVLKGLEERGNEKENNKGMIRSYVSYLLPLLVMLPFRGRLLILLLPQEYRRPVALWTSSLCLPLCRLLWVLFDHSAGGYQFVRDVVWFPRLNLHLSMGVDGISLFFLLLTGLLMPLCILSSWERVKGNPQVFFSRFVALEGLLFAVFGVTDLLVFYICFEGVLIPMFLLIGIYGGRERRIKAAYLFFLYTLLGSLLMLLGILVLYLRVGRTDYRVLQEACLDSGVLRGERERLLWLAFFRRFAVKVPMVPLHLWLPEAHVEAPTAGSVLLAGILLKLGTYGMVRFLIGLFPLASVYFTPLVHVIAAVRVIYTSLTALRQRDMKRVIAYASVAHMNMTLVGLFSMTQQGLEGAILQMLSHGVVSGALFLCVGVLYDRYHTRLIAYYGGLAHCMPVYAALFLLFIMGNIALPGTSRFVGEFMILVGIFQRNTVVTVLVSRSMVLGGGYSLWLYNRLMYGNVNSAYLRGLRAVYSDVNLREFMCLLPLAILTILMGIYPEPFLNPMHASCDLLLEYVYAAA